MKKFNLIPKARGETKFDSSEKLIDLYLDKGIESYKLNTWNLFEVELNVEDDIMFLVDSYQELRHSDNLVNHYVF